MPFLTPNRLAGLKTRQFVIPVHFLPIFEGLLDIATDAKNWQKFGDMEIEQCIIEFLEVIENSVDIP
jgi:hypothetical protein